MEGKIINFERNEDGCFIKIQLDGVPEAIPLDRKVEIKPC